jgi:hypothetical protein
MRMESIAAGRADAAGAVDATTGGPTAAHHTSSSGRSAGSLMTQRTAPAPGASAVGMRQVGTTTVDAAGRSARADAAGSSAPADAAGSVALARGAAGAHVATSTAHEAASAHASVARRRAWRVAFEWIMRQHTLE